MDKAEVDFSDLCDDYFTEFGCTDPTLITNVISVHSCFLHSHDSRPLIRNYNLVTLLYFHLLGSVTFLSVPALTEADLMQQP